MDAFLCIRYRSSLKYEVLSEAGGWFSRFFRIIDDQHQDRRRIRHHIQQLGRNGKLQPKQRDRHICSL